MSSDRGVSAAVIESSTKRKDTLLPIRRNFWKATFISLAAYAAATLIGFWGGFQYTLFIVPAFQVSWTLFCIMRIVQLRRSGAQKADAPEDDRESYGFAVGGLISSTVLLLALVVLTQVV